jgi:hypothetical protein
MTGFRFRYGIFFLMAALMFGCKKDPVQKNESGQVIVQGNITLKVRAMHHWWGVPYLPVYLKKNATETWPGPDSTLYEFQVNADNEGNCEFTHLFPGKYYIYAHGFDPLFGMNVTGYSPVELNSTTAPGNELSFTLNVSE